MEIFEQIWRVLQVVLGVGAVIFVHEAGHFLAARWCKVRVEVFSLGFGPQLFSWKRGATTYQIAALPLGGFVRMAGEDIFDDKPQMEGDVRTKTVGQRFLIYSGGVIMNVIFALVIFPILFTFGVPFTEPRLGTVTPGGPAWEAGLEEGALVTEVDGHEPIGFQHITSSVALAGPEGVELTILPPGAVEGDAPRVVTLHPRYNENYGIAVIEVAGPVDPELRMAVAEGSAAWEGGLREDDRLIAVLDGLPGASPRVQLEDALAQRTPVTLEVARGEETVRIRIEPEWKQPEGPGLLGVAPAVQHIRGLRGEAVGVGLEVEDRLVAVDGRPMLRRHDLHRALAAAGSTAEVSVVRSGRPLEVDLGLPEGVDARWALAQDIALVDDRESPRIAVMPESPAEAAGLMDGDRIVGIDGIAVREWGAIRTRAAESAQAGRALHLEVERLDAEGIAHIHSYQATPAPFAQPFYGLGLKPASYHYTSDGVVAAVQDGTYCSWKFLVDTWITLKRILFGQVSSDNIGGIITISMVSYHEAALGWTKLLFFLCMLSVNLAFINVLPIPVLDGGHLFFLIVEKIKGSPVSERVLGYSQMIGLVMILTLMIYVTFNDVVRWILPPGP